MALIKSQLVLTDGMTGPLKSINKAMNLVLNSFAAMQKASGKPIDTAALEEARRELAKAGDALNRLEGHTDRASSGFGRLAKAIGLVVVARRAFDVIKSGVDYASNLAEVQNVVDVTFGESSGVIDSWSRKSLKAYGINEVSAKRYAGTIGAMLKSSGVAGDSIVGMSQALVGLAGDMASFYNLDLDTAFQKIRSGLSGETEPLKQLGVNMSVANLEAYALSQGIEKSYSEMSQAEQVMIRYNYLLNVTKDASGDFVRTQDSWANQTRLLSESWTMFIGVLAEQLLPVLTQVISWFNSLITFLTENADTVSAVLLGLAATVGTLAVAWTVHAAAQWLAVAANRELVASLLTNPLTWIAILIGVVVAAIYKWIQSVGGLQNAWEICKAALMVAWNGILVAWNAVVFGVTWGINKVLDFVDLLKLGWHSAGVAIVDFVGDLKVSVLTILQNMINGAIDSINKFIGVLNKIPGVEIGAVEHVTFATTAAAEHEAAKQSRADDLAAYEAEIQAGKAERAANLANAKASLDNSIADLSASKGELVSLYTASRAAASEAEAAATTDEIAANTADTAANTGSTAAAIKGSSEDLKYLRDIAEMEAINRFTTAEVKIDMTGMTNRIDSSMDLDGVLTRLTDGFAEALEIAAEGVHA